jgi:DUF4097 and DUF4098 domain-containing protein YvlB
MRIVLEVENATVHAQQLDAEVSLRGRQVKLDAAGLMRRAEFDAEGGAIGIQGASDGVTIAGHNVDVALENVAGRTALRLNGGSAKLTGLQSGLEGEFVRTRVAMNTITGGVNLRIQEGKAQLTALRDGGQISVTGCPLVVDQAGGELSVTSDSDVQFTDCRATLHIDNTSGGVRGLRNDGVVELTTHKASVSLEQINGQLRISGDELDVKLVNIGAAVSVTTQSSNISIDGAAAVTIENDRGNISVKRSEAPISIKSQNGDVELLDMHGPVAVDAAGQHVEVQWTATPPDKDSRITNDGGDVTVKFAGGDCRVSATSKYGRVDSNLPGVRVVKNETTAQGIVGGGGARTVIVTATGDVHLAGPDTDDTSGQAP